MRGAVPNGVAAPRGVISVMVSPTCRHRLSASRLPMATPPAVSKSLRVPWRRFPATASMRCMSLPRTPRTSTPLPLYCDEAKACPSTSGMARRTPGTLGDAVGDLGVVGQRPVDRRHEDVAVDADDLVEQLLAEAVHDRQHDDERRDAEHDAEEREAGDDRDEALAPARAQVASGEHPFEGGEGRVPDCCRLVALRPSRAQRLSPSAARRLVERQQLAARRWRAASPRPCPRRGPSARR